MTPFDALKAANEELRTLNDMQRVLAQRVRKAEEEMSAAESELNVTRKLLGYCLIQLDNVHAKIEELTRV